MKKRENATIWERKTTGCYEFQCHNESGPIYWKQCNKSDEVCENDQCIIREEVTYSVEIEVEGINVTDLNITEIQTTTSNLTGIESDKLRIRVDTNNNNEVILIIVIVNDEETAKKVSKSINAEIDERNQEGFLRNCKSARVVVKENKLSISNGIRETERIRIMLTIVFITFIIHNH